MRKAVFATTVALAFVLAGSSPPAAFGQRTTAGIRGRVIDQSGEGIPGVKLEGLFKGESRKTVTFEQESDKKGGFIRMGIPAGPWQITFSKEGYRTFIMEINLSLGGFSESGDVVLEPAPEAPPPVAIPDAEIAAEEEEIARVGATYEAAVEALKAGNYDEAEAGLRDILESHPDVASAHYNLGYIYRMRQDWRAAETEYLRVTELEPEKVDAFVALAAVREADGRPAEAADGLLAAADAFSTDPVFQYALGVSCLNSGRSAEAEAALRKVLELDPSSAEAHFQLGTILVGQAKTDEAVATLETYVGLTGQNPANLETARALLAALKK